MLLYYISANTETIWPSSFSPKLFFCATEFISYNGSKLFKIFTLNFNNDYLSIRI